MRDAGVLLELCAKAVSNPIWMPSDGVTHCNEAANFVAMGMGCNDFERSPNPLFADEIFNFVINSSEWEQIPIEKTWEMGTNGSLVFGVANSKMLGEDHGHIATVIPGAPVLSGHWKGFSPLCMNVGKENFIGKSMSYAFREPPQFFVWKESI